jgi:hypothetical protein
MSTKSLPNNPTRNYLTRHRLINISKPTIFKISKMVRLQNRNLSSFSKTSNKENQATENNSPSIFSKSPQLDKLSHTSLFNNIGSPQQEYTSEILSQLVEEQIKSLESTNKSMSEERMKISLESQFLNPNEDYLNQFGEKSAESNVFSDLVAFNNLFNKLFKPADSDDLSYLDRIRTYLFGKFCEGLFNSEDKTMCSDSPISMFCVPEETPKQEVKLKKKRGRKPKALKEKEIVNGNEFSFNGKRKNCLF